MGSEDEEVVVARKVWRIKGIKRKKKGEKRNEKWGEIRDGKEGRKEGRNCSVGHRKELAECVCLMLYALCFYPSIGDWSWWWW